jgi:hypothetical protein
MCGIAGIIGSADQDRIERMTQIMKHRGPDSWGIKIFEQDAVALGHRRLSILDLSERGHQPMTDFEQRYWITYNGEIYNFQEIRRELLKHIGPEFDGVIAADITGPDSGAHKVNASLGKAYQGLRLGERVTTSIFMYSFSGGPERGVTMAEIKRNATTLGNPSASVAEAVEELKGRLFYIQNQSGKYFFSNQANLNRILLIRMENIPDAELRETEESLLRARLRGERFKVYLWKEESADIPDTPDLKLVIMETPSEPVMRSMLEEKGGSPRVHRNTVFFLVPIESERPSFSTLVSKSLAYRALEKDPTLSLSADQRAEIKSSLKRLEGDLAAHAQNVIASGDARVITPADDRNV